MTHPANDTWHRTTIYGNKTLSGNNNTTDTFQKLNPATVIKLCFPLSLVYTEAYSSMAGLYSSVAGLYSSMVSPNRHSQSTRLSPVYHQGMGFYTSPSQACRGAVWLGSTAVWLGSTAVWSAPTGTASLRGYHPFTIKAWGFIHHLHRHAEEQARVTDQPFPRLSYP